MKQFKTKELLDKWIHDNFYKDSDNFWDISFSPDMKEVAKKLLADGYNLDNLVASGHAYEIDGHTNDGWLFDDEVAPECADTLKAECKLIKRNSVRGKRLDAGLSRAEMSRMFEIPIRTLESWDAEVRTPPAWAEKLIIEKLERIKQEEMELREDLSGMTKNGAE